MLARNEQYLNLLGGTDNCERNILSNFEMRNNVLDAKVKYRRSWSPPCVDKIEHGYEICARSTHKRASCALIKKWDPSNEWITSLDQFGTVHE